MVDEIENPEDGNTNVVPIDRMTLLTSPSFYYGFQSYMAARRFDPDYASEQSGFGEAWNYERGRLLAAIMVAQGKRYAWMERTAPPDEIIRLTETTNEWLPQTWNFAERRRKEIDAARKLRPLGHLSDAELDRQLAEIRALLAKMP